MVRVASPRLPSHWVLFTRISIGPPAEWASLRVSTRVLATVTPAATAPVALLTRRTIGSVGRRLAPATDGSNVTLGVVVVPAAITRNCIMEPVVPPFGGAPIGNGAGAVFL